MTEAYFANDDAVIEVKRNDWAAQTFTPILPHKLFWVDLKLYATPSVRHAILEVQTTADGIPTGHVLAYHTYRLDRLPEYAPGKKYRVALNTPIPLEAYQTYALVLRPVDLLWPDKIYWRFDQGDAAYPRGNRLFSNDEGLTWVPYISDDHMFAEFGEPMSPPSEIIPPLDKFLPTYILIAHYDNGICIRLDTNAPAHLSLYHTDIEPRKHPITRIARGLNVPWFTRFCFVAPEIVEQEEVGDTIIRKFVLKPLAIGQKIHFTIRALIDGKLSPSVGPIFTDLLTGQTLIKNPSFEDWSAYPLGPDYWTRYHFGSGSSRWHREEEDVIHGKYAIHLESRSYASGTGVRQRQSAQLYRGQHLIFKAWGKGYAYANNDLTVRVDGTGGWLQHAQLTESSTWQHKTIEGTIPWDATYIELDCRAYSGSRYGVSGRWDLFTIEC